MKIGAFLIGVFIFLLSVGTAQAAPTWSGNKTFPDNGSYFGQDQQYNFTVNWTSSLAIQTVLIEHNFTGSLQNSTMRNTSLNIYTYNTSLRPGTYVWKSFANDSSGANYTNQFTYEVIKGPTFIRMLLNGTDGTVEYKPNDTANLTADLFTFKKYINISYFEDVRDNNNSLFKEWFYATLTDPVTEVDNVAWEWTPVSTQNFRGSRSLLYNLTVSNFNGYIQSRIISLNANNDYRIEFFAKTNVTSTDPDNWMTLWWYYVNVNNSLYGSCGHTVEWNNNDIRTNAYDCDSPDSRRVNRTSVGNGWEKIVVDIYEVPSSKYPNLKGAVFYFAEWTNILTGEVYIDDFSVQDMDSTANKTVNLTLNGANVGNSPGNSPLTNITSLAQLGANNITGIFAGDANFSASNRTNIAQVGFATNLVVTTDASSYAQSSSSTYKFFVNVTANYTNSTTGNPVIATCRLTTSANSDTFTMNFTNQIYNFTLDTIDLYGSVNVTVTCSGNSTHISQTNRTAIDVSFQAHYANDSRSLANANTTTTLNKTRNNLQFILSKQVNTGTGDIVTFYFVDVGGNYSLDRNYEIKGNVTVRGNVSVSNTSLLVYPCFQLRNFQANVLAEKCSPQTNLSSNNTYQLLSFNISSSDVRPSSTNYLTVTWKYNNTASTIGFNLSHNISNPALEIKSFRPFDIVTKDNDPKQANLSFTIGPDQALNVSLLTNITINNTGGVRSRIVSHLYQFPTSANVTSVIVKDSAGNSISSILNASGKYANFTTEFVTQGKVVNETVNWTCIGCISQSEVVIKELTGLRTWNVTVSSLLLQGNLNNVTAFTDYNARGALAGWTFNVTVTNSSGVFDISNKTTLSGNNLFMPVTSLSTVTYQINATGLANGVSCNNDNQCGSGLCCSNVCASTCVITTTVSTGGGGGGVLIISGHSIKITAPPRIDIFRSENKTFGVSVTNPNNDSALNKIKLTVEGYPQTQTSITPESIDSLSVNQTKYFNVSISAPLYINSGEYNISVTAEGTVNKTKKTVQAKTQMIFFIHKVLESSAIDSLAQAEQAIKEMKEASLTTKKVDELFGQAERALEDGDFDRAKLLADEIVSKKEKAIVVFNLLQEIENNIKEAKFNDLDVSETEKLYALALAAFEREDYERAEERASNALLIYSIETKNEFNIVRFVFNYWWALVIIGFILSIAAMFAYRRIALLMVRSGLNSLETEEGTIKKLVESSQAEYFENKTITTREYEQRIESYENRLVGIKKKRAKLRSSLVGMLSYSSVLETLKTEDLHLQNLIADAQKKYFTERSITQRVYEKTIQELLYERAEIQKNIEFAVAKDKNNRILDLFKVWR